MNTILAKAKLQHLNSITHEGKVVVLATDGDGKIWYIVKQDGFEESYLNTPEDQRTGWENWQELEFPNETEKDQSVSDQEKAELTYKNNDSKFILRSCYNTRDKSDVAPVQLVSALGHIYVFRQSKGKTLLVDRFVLDGMTNKLNRKLEVRFKRSKQKHTPTKNMKKGNNGLENVDTLDFRDADGNFFYEPTTELCIVDQLDKGWFSVVLVPTIENDVYRWHIFAYNSSTKKVELTTIRASEEGLFDVKDYTVFDDVNDTLVPRSIPGIIKRTLDISSVTVNNGLAATKYDLQQEQQTKSGEMQLIKTATRLMLAIPTDKGAAALSFAIAGDGTLAQISEEPKNEVIRSKQREVLLPLNTLDKIKAFGDKTPPPEGKITGLAVGTDEDDAEDLVKISTDGDVVNLTKGDLVKITETKNYQGLYSITRVDENRFTVDLSSGNGLGAWEKQEQEAGGLIFDGMITAYEKTADGKLKVTCPNHGLNNGEQVQIAGTGDYNDTYPVRKIDNNHFVIERKWATGEAINVQRIAQKRRGIVFNGNNDYIAISGDGLKAFSANEDFEATCSAWIYDSEAGSGEQLIVGQNSRSISLFINQSGKVAFRVLAGTSLEVEDPVALPPNQWVHYAGVVKCNKETQETTLRLCKNGVEVVTPKVLPQNITPVLKETKKLVVSDSQASNIFGNPVAISGDTVIVGSYKENQAYIFQRNAAGTWEQVQKLTVSNKESDESFGNSVAISGDTAIVGNYLKEESRSSAYIFQRNAAGTWEQVQKLTAKNSEDSGWFGCSVAISRDTAIVGNMYANSKKGSAYIFQRNAAGTWEQVQKLTAKNSKDSNEFGYSIAISGDTVIVGGVSINTQKTRAYIFQRNAGRWQEVEEFIIPISHKRNEHFYHSVAISGDTAIVGIPKGCAYIFQRKASGWQEVEKFGSDLDPSDNNTSVAISGDTAIVGTQEGGIYILQRKADRWKPVQELIASDSQSGNKFSPSVAISGDTAIVGTRKGSAYIFTLQKDLKFRIGESFVGKIADVQIWNKARTAEDIKNNMYLQLTGQEVGLVGYWRLGAIVEEKERKVLDFSVNKNHGIVHGEAYVSDITLERNLQSGTPAIKYENEDLFAVSERATYEEEFEFKTSSNLAPDKADGGNDKIFAITLKGKKSRSSQDWIEIPKNENVTEFSSSGNGWHKAKLRFTVPDGVSLLRSFGISDLKGQWKNLNIRKHSIRLLSDSITEAKYTDQVNLTTLADHQKELPEMLEKLELKEQEEATLLKEKRELEDKITPVDTAKLDAQKAKVTQLEKIKNQLEQKYEDAKNDLLNYFCEIKLPDNSRSDIMFKYLYAEPGGTNDRGAKVLIALAKDKWEFIPNENGTYKIKLPDNYRPEVIHRYLHASTATNEWGNKVVTWSRGHDWEVTPVPNKNGQYNIELCDPDYPKKVKYAHLHAEAHFMISNLVTWKSGDPWELITTGEPSDNKKIDSAHKESQRANQNYTIEENYLQRLQQSHNANTAQKEEWQKRLDEVNSQLKVFKKQLDQLNKDFINKVSQTQQTAQTLPQVFEVKKLVTQGALLGFVQPASRLNAIETCEGNVQLSYFDTEGRMRQTNYDATADSKNNTFEQWLPDANRVCLSFSNDNSVVRLKDAQGKPLYLNLDWSIEAWFVYPLPENPPKENLSKKDDKAVWHTLTRGKDRDCHIVVKNRNQLGIYLNEIPTGLTESFCDSGYNLDLLTPGWHHLTAVGRGDTTLFYIDGQKVGDTKKQACADAERARDAIAEESSDDYIQANQKVEIIKKAVLKASNYIDCIGNIDDKEQFGKEQFGKLAEVRIWGIALSEEEIAVNSKTLLNGNEPGLLAYYPMNEADGTTVRDHTGNGYNGTVSGASWWGCSAPIGKVGNKYTAMEFNGVNDYVNLGNPTELQFPTNDYTLEAWIKPSQSSKPQAIISKWNEGSKGWYMFSLRQDNKISIKHNRDPWNIDSSQTIPFKIYSHVVATYDGSTVKLYINGQPAGEGKIGKQEDKETKVLIGACHNNGKVSQNFFLGQIAEVRIWNKARTQAEIQADMYKRLSGKESNLVAYYPLSEIQSGKVLDLVGNNQGTVQGEAIIVENNTLPLDISDALVCNEYSTVTIDPETNRKVAIMRRFLGYPTTDRVRLLPDKRVEKLELKWIGNAQFAPTLLGYIEGAPPVPSENLTIEDDYNGATSVELTMSEDVAFSWNRGTDFGRGSSHETFIGVEAETDAGFAITTRIAGMRAGFKGNLNHSTQSLNETSITSSSFLLMTDKLELRGTPEQTAKFPNLGTRFIPKNVGYALVVSALADVFVTRLARSGKMVGYQVQPVEGISPDVNTITFLINPAYTMNGSLDGLTGSSPTSDRFFKHVPEMRSQYGSLYPASYYRLKEAYDLKKQIEAEDKRRESYFSNFNVRALNETSLFQNIDRGDASPTIGVQRAEDQPSSEITEEEKRKAEERKGKKAEAEAAAAVENNRSATEQKQAEIKKRIKDQEKQVQATSGLTNWQKRMEDIQIRANKRNIVNTYVWDADGGLRTEAQSFANTVEHTIGGSFTLDTAFGGEGNFAVVAATVELTSQATINLTQTMSKTEARSKGFQLNVELGDLEHKGITNHDNKPILPGEKVNRYRFMSFYLEGSSQNFGDFFEYVVDPEWLHSNSEGARALRQAQAGKPNKAWRVLHRVTYVERPALMGFGRDVRKLPAAAAISENQQLLEKIANLEKANRLLEDKLDKILKFLEGQK